MSHNKSDLSFGQRAVDLNFNPPKDDNVLAIKLKAAELIDLLHDLREASQDSEEKDEYTLAIRSIQAGQMWGVKAAMLNL